jgi:SIR2-like domain
VQNAREFANELLRENRKSREKLFAVIGFGEAIAFVGAGLSAGANLGYPTWSNLLQKLFQEANEIAPFEARTVAENALFYADEIKAHFKAHDALDKFKAALCREYSPREEDNTSSTHHRLMQLPFRAFVTTNYDWCLEQALSEYSLSQSRKPPPDPCVIVKANGEDRHMVSNFFRSLVERRGSDRRYVAHIHGCYNDAENIILSASEYSKAYGFVIEKGQISRRKPSSTLHRQFAWSLFASRRLVFFGCSMEDPYIKALLDAVATDLWEWNLPIHFVVLPIDEGALASVDIRVAEFKRYGVEVVFFENWDGTYAGLDSMLDEAKLVARVGDGATASRLEKTYLANEDDAASSTPTHVAVDQKVNIHWLDEVNEKTIPRLRER